MAIERGIQGRQGRMFLFVNDICVFFLLAALLAFAFYFAGNIKEFTEKTVSLFLRITLGSSILLFLFSFVSAALYLTGDKKRPAAFFMSRCVFVFTALVLAFFSLFVLVISQGRVPALL